jgi:hypothetical protein
MLEDGTPVEAYAGRPLLSNSVHHVDVVARRITVYAQGLLHENADGTGAEVVVSPPQLPQAPAGPTLSTATRSVRTRTPSISTVRARN